jgi:hypothetical protein
MKEEVKRDEVFEASALATMRALGMEPDSWQMEVLTGTEKRLLLNCCRQAGKSTTVAVLSVLETVARPGTRVLIVAPSFRQSRLVFKLAAGFLGRLGRKYVRRHTLQEITLSSSSQIICLPCKEETIRGYSDVRLMIIDEAARVPDDIFKAVTPMLAVSDGRMICLSTPYGRRGYFYNAWAKGGDDWKRIEVPVSQISRIGQDYLDRALREMGESWFRQEFHCSFEALEGLVYPDFARCVVKVDQVPTGRWFGGLDFGLRNPFAAVWGVLDRDDVFWLVGEHYARDQPLAYHAQHLPKRVMWYGDPEGAREIKELRCAGFAVRTGDNDQRPGINTVRSRLQTGRLKILEGACPNLLAEAQLYCYDPDSTSEKPRKEHDHALDALRYVISKIDWRKMATIKKTLPLEELGPPDSEAAAPALPSPLALQPPPAPQPRKWLRYDNEALWTRLN